LGIVKVMTTPTQLPTKPRAMTVWPADAGEEAPYAIRVDWGLFKGRWEPETIRVHARLFAKTGPITGATLRSLPIGQIVGVLRDRHKALAEKVASEVEVPDDYLERWEKGERPKLGREHYEDVAIIYRAAFDAGLRPTKAVAEHFNCSASTAGSWVSRARHRYGLLGDTSMGKAGS